MVSTGMVRPMDQPCQSFPPAAEGRAGDPLDDWRGRFEYDRAAQSVSLANRIDSWAERWFRNRSSTVHSTVHTTVQTHATDSSGRWLIRWRESRSASAQPVPARRSPVDDSASPACCATNRDVLLRSASRRKFASKLFRLSIQGGLQSERSAREGTGTIEMMALANTTLAFFRLRSGLARSDSGGEMGEDKKGKRILLLTG